MNDEGELPPVHPNCRSSQDPAIRAEDAEPAVSTRYARHTAVQSAEAIVRAAFAAIEP